jgi:2-polyprenyl-6-methoxyphenol hydroxylase-like FAD-dependent oxidoreductase
MTTDSPQDSRPDVDVCVHGAGAVGSALALALSQQGFQVTLAGETVGAVDDVRAYALNAASVTLLAALGVWDRLPRDAMTAVHEMRVAGDRGGALSFSAWEQCVSELAWIVDAAALDLALACALREAPRVTHLTRADAAPPAGLIALCEGKDSTRRAALGVRYEREAYTHHALAARLVSDQPHDGVAWQWFRAPDVLALLPFDRPTPGHSFGLVWSQPAADAQRWLTAQAGDFEAALNAATGGTAGRLTLASHRRAWPLVTAQADPWCGAGWVLLGDAAHAVHPLAGQGLNLGLADVACLARVLRAACDAAPWRPVGDARTLRRYARERAAPTRAMNGAVDGLWQLFAHDELPLPTLRNRGMSLVNHAPLLKRWLVARALG